MRFILLLAALLASASANAQRIGHISNDAGGQITITENEGAPCEPGESIAFSTTKGGEAVYFGCWVYGSGHFFVRWQNGQKSAYAMGELTLDEDFVAKMEAMDEPVRKTARGGVK